MTSPARLLRPWVALAAVSFALVAAAQDKELNLYTARHYQTDEALYSNFTKATGIRVNRIEGGEDALFERIKAEGASSPADVFLTVDAGRLWRADEAGVFAKVESPVLEKRIPTQYRDPQGKWYGFSARARLIVYNKDAVKQGEIRNYEDLADPRWKGKVCVRSSGHPYQLSLIASVLAHDGPEKKGGDTDQIKAVAVGECDVALTNQYYLVRLMRSQKPEDKAIVAKIGWVWPNQDNRGVQMNISGGGMLKNAPHKEAAVKFLEYLASDEAQRYFADGNNEWPVVPGVKITNADLDRLGEFKADTLNVGLLGRNQAAAQRAADRAGYK
jgi:iron(III) transport system substrate-binding protein